MPYSSYRKFPKPIYTTLVSANKYNCNGSKCSCQFKDQRTFFDATEINSAQYMCKAPSNYNENYEYTWYFGK